YQGRTVFAFTRAGDTTTQQFARSLGASWAGASADIPPEPLDAAIIFASAGELVPQALKVLAPGGTVVCAGIHMSDIPSFPYADLWQERTIRSVANLTRADARAFLTLAPTVPIRTTVTRYPLSAAPQALEDLRAGRFTGAAVAGAAPATAAADGTSSSGRPAPATFERLPSLARMRRSIATARSTSMSCPQTAHASASNGSARRRTRSQGRARTERPITGSR